MQGDYIARRIEVEGIVQGVGFRPFVYQLANRHNLKGEVLNTSSGVSIHVEGIDKDIDFFCRELKKTVHRSPVSRMFQIIPKP